MTWAQLSLLIDADNRMHKEQSAASDQAGSPMHGGSALAALAG